ncbi:MAG: hypothetical protein BWY80_01486 [Firmicutes bacterium ADurb.Bin456]|nr:MAG: hypothetical protein BWY80_01486 [Firmicutes bacterium ADurb.Bin456]
MRLSVPACFCLILAAALILFTYALNPDPSFLLTALPMLVVLAGVPLVLNLMNKRQAEKVNMEEFRLYPIKDLARLNPGDPVRLRGKVEALSLKWLNRPHFRIDDGSGKIGIMLFAAAHEDIKPGDTIEAAGTLRIFGKSREKKIFGVRVVKLKG